MTTELGVLYIDDELNNIFELLYKNGKDSKRNGIGLNIVNKGVDKLECTIKVDSEVHRGSVFALNISNHKITNKFKNKD